MRRSGKFRDTATCQKKENRLSFFQRENLLLYMEMFSHNHSGSGQTELTCFLDMLAGLLWLTCLPSFHTFKSFPQQTNLFLFYSFFFLSLFWIHSLAREELVESSRNQFLGPPQSTLPKTFVSFWYFVVSKKLFFSPGFGFGLVILSCCCCGDSWLLLQPIFFTRLLLIPSVVVSKLQQQQQ